MTQLLERAPAADEGAWRIDLGRPTGGRAWRRRMTDRAATIAVIVAFALAIAPLVSVVWLLVSRGMGRLNPYFLTHSMRGVYGGMDAGGIYHAILGSVEITALAALFSVPIGLACAVYLVEYGKGRLARAVTLFVDVMTGIPSIVAGLFAFSLFFVLAGPSYKAGLVGAVALAVLMIPIVVRSSEEMLRLVPNELREAAYALGVPKWRVVTKVVLRTASSGLVTGIMIAIARVIGETAPLLIAVGTVDSINANPLDGRMMTLPVFIFRQYSQGTVPCAPSAADCIATINYDRAWAAALVLMIIVMILNLAARLIARWLRPKGA